MEKTMKWHCDECQNTRFEIWRRGDYVFFLCSVCGDYVDMSSFVCDGVPFEAVDDTSTKPKPKAPPKKNVHQKTYIGQQHEIIIKDGTIYLREL